MKKILFLVVVLLAALAGRAQVVTISNPYKFLQWISVKDSVRGAIFLQNGDTLATQAYARGFAGSGVGYGIKRVAGNITFDSAVARKLDTAYAVNDSTIGYKINGHVYTFLIRGRYSPGTPCTGCLLASNNFSDIGNTSTARTNLGLGTASTKDAPASGNASSTQVVLGSDTRLAGGATPTLQQVLTAGHAITDAGQVITGGDSTNLTFSLFTGLTFSSDFNSAFTYGGNFQFNHASSGTQMFANDKYISLKAPDSVSILKPTKRFAVNPASVFRDTVTITTMGTADSSDRAVTSAWVKRQAYGTGVGSISGAGNLSPLFTTGVSGSSITFTQSTVSAHSYFGNNQGFSSVPVFLTNTQLTADMNLFSNSLQGMAPASGGGTTNFLRADGSWAAPAGTGATNLGQSQNATTYTITSSTGSPATLLGVTGSLAGLADTAMKRLSDSLHNGTWAAAHPFNLRHGTEFGAAGINSDSLYAIPDTMTARLNLFTTTAKGLAPLSGGGTTNFLRADGTWAAPPGGGGGGALSIPAKQIVYGNAAGVAGSYNHFIYDSAGNLIQFGDTTLTTPAAVRGWFPNYNSQHFTWFLGGFGTREINWGNNFLYPGGIHQSQDTSQGTIYGAMGSDNGFNIQAWGKGHSNFLSDHITKRDMYNIFGKNIFKISLLMSGNDPIGSQITANGMYTFDPASTNREQDSGTYARHYVSGFQAHFAGNVTNYIFDLPFVSSDAQDADFANYGVNIGKVRDHIPTGNTSTDPVTIFGSNTTGSMFSVWNPSADDGPYILRAIPTGQVGFGITTPTARVHIKAATTGYAAFRLQSSSGVNPSSPNNGDLWWNGTNLYFYNGSSSVDLAASAGAQNLESVLNQGGTLSANKHYNIGGKIIDFNHASGPAIDIRGVNPALTVTDTVNSLTASAACTGGYFKFDATTGTVIWFNKSFQTYDVTNFDAGYGANTGSIRCINGSGNALSQPNLFFNSSTTGDQLTVAGDHSFGTYGLVVKNAGLVGIKTNSPDSALTVTGSVHITGTLRADGIPNAPGTKVLRYNPSTGVYSYADTAVNPNTFKEVVTTDATATILDTLAVPDNSVVEMDVSVIGTDAGNTVVNYIRKVRILRVTGTYTLLNSATVATDYQDASMTSTSITITTASGLPVLKVTGITSHNIAWKSVRSNRLVQVLTP